MPDTMRYNTMRKAKKKRFLYRVDLKTNKGKQKQHLADVISTSDESARRAIIHTAMKEGGNVISITQTFDGSRYPGETQKRYYKD